jgi:hypothetical protein
MIGFGDCPQKSKVLGHRRSEAERLSTSLNRAVSLVKKIGPKRSVAIDKRGPIHSWQAWRLWKTSNW